MGIPIYSGGQVQCSVSASCGAAGNISTVGMVSLHILTACFGRDAAPAEMVQLNTRPEAPALVMYPFSF